MKHLFTIVLLLLSLQTVRASQLELRIEYNNKINGTISVIEGSSVTDTYAQEHNQWNVYNSTGNIYYTVSNPTNYVHVSYVPSSGTQGASEFVYSPTYSSTYILESQKTTMSTPGGGSITVWAHLVSDAVPTISSPSSEYCQGNTVGLTANHPLLGTPENTEYVFEYSHNNFHWSALATEYQSYCSVNLSSIISTGTVWFRVKMRRGSYETEYSSSWLVNVRSSPKITNIAIQHACPGNIHGRAAIAFDKNQVSENDQIKVRWIKAATKEEIGDDTKKPVTTTNSMYGNAWSSLPTISLENKLIPADNYIWLASFVGGTCESSISGEIKQLKDIIISDVTNTDVSCINGKNGTYSFSVSNEESNANNVIEVSYIDNNNGITKTIRQSGVKQNYTITTGLEQGTYTITASYVTFITPNDGTCGTKSENVIINEPSALNINVDNSSIANPTCESTPNGSFSIIATGGSSNVTYELYKDEIYNKNTTTTKPNCTARKGANETVTFSGLSAGTYHVRAVDQCGSNEARTSDIKLDFTPLTIDENYFSITNEILKCHNDNDGAVTFRANGGSGSYLWSLAGKPSVNATSGSFTNLSAGTYTLELRNANNSCPDVVAKNFTISQPDPLTVSSSITHVGCNNDDDGSITLSVAGGNGGYSYMWDGELGYQLGNSSYTELPAGSYRCDVYDANGCSTTTAPLTVQQPAAPLSSLSCDFHDVVCHGEAANIGLSITGGWGNYTYHYRHVESGSTHTSPLSDYQPTQAGSYKIWVEDKDAKSNACTSKNDVTVKVTTPAEPLTLQVKEIPKKSNNLHISCKGMSDGDVPFSVTGGNGDSYEGYTVWAKQGTATSEKKLLSNGAIGNLHAGTWRLYAEDERHCRDSTSFTLTEPDAALQLYVDEVRHNWCFQDSIGEVQLRATGGVGPYYFEYDKQKNAWQNSSIFAQLKADSHMLFTVRDVGGCSATVATVLRDSSTRHITIQGSVADATCHGVANGSYQFTPIGDLKFVKYTWDGVDIPSTLVENVAAGTHRIEVKDEGGCHHEQIVTVGQANPLTVVQMEDSAATCHSAPNGWLRVVTQGGSAQLRYSMVNAQTDVEVKSHSTTQPSFNTRVATLDTVILDSIQAGSYFLRITDECGVIRYTSEALDFHFAPLRVAQLSHDTLLRCFDDDYGAIEAAAQGGIGLYQWSLQRVTPAADSLQHPQSVATRNAQTQGISMANFSDLPANYYRILLSNQPRSYPSIVECPDVWDTTIHVAQHTPIKITPILSHIVCYGDSSGAIALSVSGGVPYTKGVAYRYAWNPGKSSSMASAHLNLPAGSYSCEVRDSLGCLATVDATLYSISSQYVTLQDNVVNATCYGVANGSYRFNSKSDLTFVKYMWDGVDITNTLVENVAAGIHRIRVEDEGGCYHEQAITVLQPDSLLVQLTDSAATCHSVPNGWLQVVTQGGSAQLRYSLVDIQSDAEVRHSTTAQDSFQTRAINSDTVLFDSIPAGKYLLRVTDECGMASYTSDTLDFHITPLRIAQLCYDTLLHCFGDTDGKIDIAAQGGIGQYQWSLQRVTPAADSLQHPLPVAMRSTQTQASNTASFDTLPANYYHILLSSTPRTYPSYVECPDVQDTTIHIAQHTPIRVTPTLSHVACYGDSSGAIALSVTGGLPHQGKAAYRYAWSTGKNSDTASVHPNLSAGIYHCEVRDSLGCPMPTDTLSLYQPTDSLRKHGYRFRDIVCFGDSANLLTSFSGGWGSYTYLYQHVEQGFTDTIFTPRYQPHVVGHYKVWVEDRDTISGNVCHRAWHDTLVVVSQPSAPLQLRVVDIPRHENGFHVSCRGSRDGSIAFCATGGNGEASDTLSRFQGYDSYCIVAKQGEEVLQKIAQNVYDNNGVSLLCDTMLNFCGDGWTLHVTDSRGCTSSDTSIVLAVPAQHLFLVVDSVVNNICADDSIGQVLLHPEGGIAPYYFRYGNGVWQDSSRFTNLKANADMLFTLRDSAGCLSDVRTSLRDVSTRHISLWDSIADATCYGVANGSYRFSPTGDLKFVKYTWNEANISDTLVENVAAGTHLIRVEDEGGCRHEQLVTLLQPDSLLVQMADSAATCHSVPNGWLRVTTQGGSAQLRYSLVNIRGGEEVKSRTTTQTDFSKRAAGSDIVLFDSVAAGSYFLHVTDECGMASYASDTLNFHFAPLRVAQLRYDSLLRCFDDTYGKVEAVAQGGIGLYQWSLQRVTPAADSFQHPQSVATRNAQTQGNGQASFDALPANHYQISVSNQPRSYPSFVECIDVQDTTIHIAQHTPIRIAPTLDHVICYGDSTGKISLSVSGGLPYSGSTAYRYAWSTGKNSATASVHPNLTAGSYGCLVRDSLGCLSEVNAELYDLTRPITITDSVVNALCYGAANARYYFWPSGDLPFARYTLDSADFYNMPITGIAAGAHRFIAWDTAGCYAERTFNVTQPTPLQAYVEGKPVCSNDPFGHLTTTAQGGTRPYAYRLTHESAYYADSVLLTEAGTRQVEVKDAQGCLLTTEPYEVEVRTLKPQPAFLVSTHSLMGDTLMLVEHSLPEPDSVQWYISGEVSYYLDSAGRPHLLMQRDGEATVRMVAYYEGCNFEVEKPLVAHEFDTLLYDYRGRGEQPDILDMLLSPNPARGEVRMKVTLSAPKALTLWVRDLMGTVVLRKQYNATSESVEDTVLLPAAGTRHLLFTLYTTHDARTQRIVQQE